MHENPGQKKGSIIRTPDHRLRVFISSTLKELAEERDIVRQSVLKLRLVPVMFEAGARPHPAAELYRAYLSQSHMFIGIYWQSYGWVGPGMDISGLEDEYNLSTNLPRLIYIKSPAQQRDPGLERLLKRLQDENTASYKHFKSSADLGELVENDLALLLTESYEAATRSGPIPEFVPHPLTNIPFPRNPLLDRESEMKIIREWLSRDEAGLITLTGAGGAGKSRLALEAALLLREGFPDGAYLVRLSPVSDATRVVPAIAETLGLRESPQTPPVEEMLTSFLRDKKMLLILDNFEQVLPAARKISELLETCPRLKMLVTSRAPLHLRAEKELPVPPLSVPGPREDLEPERLSQYAAVRLFIQRARDIRPDFKITNENAPAVAEICYRLDGLPLAIELAASRIKLLHPRDLLIRLDRRFDLLRGGTRDLPERQQTLRAAIDWSYNLLSEPSRALFRRLSVFSGSWSLEAAEAICNSDRDLGPSVFEEIESLVDFSMVVPVDGLEDSQRFGMLESIREYAWERLEECGEAEGARLRHAQYFLDFVREIEPRTRTSERTRWRAIMEQDMENLRRVLDESLEEPATLEIGQDLAVNLAYYWGVGSSMTEGRRYAERFLAKVHDGTPPLIRAGLLCLVGALLLFQGEGKASNDALQEALIYAKQTDKKWTLGTSLLWSGSGLLVLHDFETAASQLKESREIFREIGDKWSEVMAVLWMSNAATMLGDLQGARKLFDECLVLARAQGDPWSLVAPLVDVAQDALINNELEKADATLREIESLCREVGGNWTLAWILSSMAQIDLSRADVEAARGHLLEAFQEARQYGNVMASALSLVETALFMIMRLKAGIENVPQRSAGLRRAALLGGATKALADDPAVLGRGIGTRQIYNTILAQASAAIDTETWDRGFTEGISLSLNDALALAAMQLQESGI